jgi:hypothetical protein
MAELNGNGMIPVSVDVLAERVGNIAKRLDESVALSKSGNDAALTAIGVAKVDQERTVTVAFAASQAANLKTEQAQKESNQKIGTLENDVVRLTAAQAQSSGMKEMFGYVLAVATAIAAMVGMFVALHR